MLRNTLRAVAFATLGLSSFAVGCSGGAGSSATSSEDAVVSAPEVNKAVDDLNAANDAVDEVERRLADEMQLVGAALSADQQEKYTQAFELIADVKAAHDSQNTAALALEKALKDLLADGDRARQAMEGGRLWVSHGEVGYKQIYRDMALLAKSPVAGYALEFGAKVIAGDAAYTDKHLTLDKFHKSEKDFMNDIVAAALPKEAATELAKADDQGKAKQAIRAKIQPLLDKLNDPDQVGTMHDQIDAINQVLDLADTRLQDLVDADGNLKHPNLEADVSNLSIAVQAVNAILGVWHAGLDLHAFNEGDMSAFVKLLQSGPDAVDGVAEAANNLRHVIVGKDSLQLGDIANFAAKIASGVGLIVSSIDTYKDIKDAVDNHAADEATVLKIFGDFLGIASGALGLVTVTNPFVGPALAVFSILVDLYIDHLANVKRAQLEQQEMPGLLSAAGLDDATAAAFAGLDKHAGKVISGLGAAPDAKKHPGPGLAPDTIQWLARTSPDLVHKVGFLQHGSDRVDGLTVVVRAYGLDAAHARELLDASLAGVAPADAAEVLFDAFEIMRGAAGDDPTASDAKATVLKDIQANGGSDAKRQAAASALATYLQAH
jgi:hypothetical protein